jgi:hypothetical protein
MLQLALHLGVLFLTTFAHDNGYCANLMWTLKKSVMTMRNGSTGSGQE